MITYHTLHVVLYGPAGAARIAPENICTPTRSVDSVGRLRFTARTRVLVQLSSAKIPGIPVWSHAPIAQMHRRVTRTCWCGPSHTRSCCTVVLRVHAGVARHILAHVAAREPANLRRTCRFPLRFLVLRVCFEAALLVFGLGPARARLVRLYFAPRGAWFGPFQSRVGILRNKQAPVRSHQHAGQGCSVPYYTQYSKAAPTLGA